MVGGHWGVHAHCPPMRERGYFTEWSEIARSIASAMFFFFAGAVEQQVRQVLKVGPGRCFRCASPADLVHCDKVLKLFFVPVWRWPAKDPALYCTNCSLFFPTTFSPPSPGTTEVLPSGALRRCASCSRPVDHPDFRFCPFCGSSL